MQEGRSMIDLHFDHADLGALVQRRHLVDGAVSVIVVAEVERADDGVRVMHGVEFRVVGNKNQLVFGEVEVAVHRRRDWVRVIELGRVADDRCTHVELVVEVRNVVDCRHRQNHVALWQVLAVFPLNGTLVRAAHVHHLGYKTVQTYDMWSQARSYIGTRGQLGGVAHPRRMLCPSSPKRPTSNFFYTLIFHHQCH